jgi:hypothetical protein
MTTITTNRGTSTMNTQGLVFKKVSSKLPKNETITINRGTSVIKTKDIPNIAKPSLKGQTITVKRGTEVITL